MAKLWGTLAVIWTVILVWAFGLGVGVLLPQVCGPFWKHPGWGL